MAACYAASDVFVFPTTGEGFSNALNEAMFAGLPVVTSWLRGTTDMAIHDGVNGCLVEPGDQAGFVSRVGRLVRDADLRAQLGARARQDVREAFGFESYCRKLRAFYLEVASAKSPRD